MSDETGQERSEREAAEWLSRLNDRSVSTEMLDAFFVWRRDADNAAAFSRIEYLWDRSAALGTDRDIAFAVQDALERRAPPRGGLPAWLASRRMVLAGGAGLIALGGLGWSLRAAQYKTAIGEQRTVMLDDGSKIEINTDSALSVTMSAHARSIRLERGEAWFDVAHDPDRPFSVRSADTVVTALGTSFSVRQQRTGARIVLAEGKVDVASGSAPGQQMRVAATWVEVRDGVIGKALPADLVAEMGWRSGKLSFRETPLGQAVDEVNRYSRRRIRLDAGRFETVPVNGTFETGDIAAFATAVTALFPLAARPADDGDIVLTAR